VTAADNEMVGAVGFAMDENFRSASVIGAAGHEFRSYLHLPIFRPDAITF
jgi:hypothetical protein